MPYPFTDALSLLKVEAPGLLAKEEGVTASPTAGVAAACAAAAGPTTAFGKELACLSTSEREPHIGKAVLSIVHDLSGSSSASVDTPLMEAGVDSLAATELSNRLAKLTELTLPFTLLFEYPTSRAVSGYILEHSGVVAAEPLAAAVPSAVRTVMAESRGAIAIANAVGQSPGAMSTGKPFAQMVQACGDAVNFVPLARWDLEKLINDPVTQHTFYQRGFKDGFNESQKLSVQHGGFLEAVEMWDCKFFGVASAEAACMDPQQRLLLEMGYAALHGASRRRASCMQTDTGVFVGIERPDCPSSRTVSLRLARRLTEWATLRASPRGASPSPLASMARARALTRRAPRRSRLCTALELAYRRVRLTLRLVRVSA
jgi:acyl carrier protein